MLGIVSITIIFHLYDFGLPPIWPDEAHMFIAALSMINSPDSDLYNYSLGFTTHIDRFPVYQAPFIGTLESYLSTPVLYFLGINVTSIRLYQMFVAISVVIFTYFAGKEIFSRQTGIIASSLLATMPAFVFYSRQFVAYDYALISIMLLVIIFGIRFLKTLQIKYLAGTLLPIGFGIWAYLWFLWFVLGFIVTIPLAIKIFNSKFSKKIIKTDLKKKNKIETSLKDQKKLKLVFLSICFLVLGFTPLILQYVEFQERSLIPHLFAAVGIGGEPEPLNANFGENLVKRGSQLVEILEYPRIGLWFANLFDLRFSETISYSYIIMLMISLPVLLIYAIGGKVKSKSIIGLLLVFVTFLISSSFTLQVFSPIHLLFLLPLIFIIIGLGIEIISKNKKVIKTFEIFRIKINSNVLIITITIVIILTQLPFLIDNYKILENQPNANAHIPYQNLASYLNEKNLTPVSMGWWTDRTMVVYTNGEHPPVLLRSNVPMNIEFNDSFKENMRTLEQYSLLYNRNYLSEEFLFVMYTYPEMPNCSELPVPSEKQFGFKCAQAFLIESAAERNNRSLEIIDFPLPDGNPYLRSFRFLD